MTKRKNLMTRKSTGWKIGDRNIPVFESTFGENKSNRPIEGYRRRKSVVSGKIGYFKICNADEAEITIKGAPLKVKGKLIEFLYVCFEKGYFVNVVIEVSGYDFEVTSVIGYDLYIKLWRIYRDEERVKVTREQKEGTAIREGLLEDILETESGSIAVEFEGNVFEIQPKHFQKVLQYIASEAVVEFEIDMEQGKLLSVQAKDPTISLNRLQEYLFMRDLDRYNTTTESLMLYYNYIETMYTSLLKGTSSIFTEEKIVA